MWSCIKIIFGFAAGIFSWLRDRKHAQALKSQIDGEENAQILKGIKRAKDIAAKPLPDDLLLPPSHRGAGANNED